MSDSEAHLTIHITGTMRPCPAETAAAVRAAFAAHRPRLAPRPDPLLSAAALDLLAERGRRATYADRHTP